MASGSRRTILEVVENTTITHCRPTNSTVRKRRRTLTVKMYKEDNKSKAFSSLFFTKMTAKLEKDTKYCLAKQIPNTDPGETMGASINNE